jgi:hypothetical protein
MLQRAFTASVVLILCVLVTRVVFEPGYDVDTMNLVLGIPHLMRCVAEGTLGERCEGASPVAPLQHAPAAAALLFTDDFGVATHLLVGLNLIAFLALAVIGGYALLRQSMVLAYAWVLVLAASPLLFFATRSFAEMLACLAATGLCVAIAGGASAGAIAVLALLTGLSKDTAPAFVMVLAVTTLGSVTVAGRPRRWVGPITAVSIGAGVSVLVGVAFNLVRFGTWWNVFYADDFQRFHGGHSVASFTAAALVSPSGGILFYWPALTLLLAVAIGADAWRPRRWLIPLCLLVYCLALGNWYSPFGWITWGNRLLMPWLPPLAFILLLARVSPVVRMFRLLSTRPALAIVAGAVLAILSLPQWLVVLDRRWALDVFRPVPGCEVIPRPSVDLAYYYQCLDHYLWPTTPTIVRMLGSWTANAQSILAAAAYVALFVTGVPLACFAAAAESRRAEGQVGQVGPAYAAKGRYGGSRRSSREKLASEGGQEGVSTASAQ